MVSFTDGGLKRTRTTWFRTRYLFLTVTLNLIINARLWHVTWWCDTWTVLDFRGQLTPKMSAIIWFPHFSKEQTYSRGSGWCLGCCALFVYLYNFHFNLEIWLGGEALTPFSFFFIFFSLFSFKERMNLICISVPLAGLHVLGADLYLE